MKKKLTLAVLFTGLIVPGFLVAQEPAIEIVSTNISGSNIKVIFQTERFDFPAPNHAVHVYFDNDFIQRELANNKLDLNCTKVGEHAIVLVLADGSLGHYLELQNPQAIAAKIIRLELPCEGPGDPACDDGNPCSLDMCNESGTGFLCEYGVTPQGLSCCTSDYQCPDGRICLGHECSGCTINSQCDDGNECTVNRCEAGACIREVIAGCCTLDGACDDGDPCTANDTCLNGTCSGTSTACPDEPDCTGGEDCAGDSTSSGHQGNAGSGCGVTSSTCSAGIFILLILVFLVLFRPSSTPS